MRTRHPDLRAVPMLVLAVAIGTGACMAHLLERVPAFWWGGIALGCWTVGFALSRLWERWSPLGLHALAHLFFVVAGCVGFGAARYATWFELPPHHVGRLLQAEETLTLTLLGEIRGAVTLNERGMRTEVEVHAVLAGLDTFPAVGRLILSRSTPRFAPEPLPPLTLYPGQRVEVTGRARGLPAPRNPADFDYGRFLALRNVWGTISVTDSSGIWVKEDRSTSLQRVVRSVQTYIKQRIERFIPTPEGRALLTALLLGDRSELKDETRSDFSRTGLMHLLAVSGLHVLLVGMVLHQLLLPFVIRLRLPHREGEWIRTVTTLVILGLYMFITGMSASVVRAVTMAAAMLIGHVLQRNSPAMNRLGLAALVLLLLRPTSVFDVGFLLSFSAVAGLVLLSPVIENWFPTWARRKPWIKPLQQSLTASIAATLGTGPVLAGVFGQLPLAGILLNVVAIPATLLGFSAGLGLVISPHDVLSIRFGYAADLCLKIVSEVATWGASTLDPMLIRVSTLSFGLYVASIGTLILIAAWHLTKVRIYAVYIVLLGICGDTLVRIPERKEKPALDVLFFDVGQGDAALVRLPNGKHILIDTGAITETSSSAERTLLPHMQAFGIAQLDAVMLSHAHADHSGGLMGLINAQVIHILIHSVDNPDTPYYQTIIQAIHQHQIATRKVVRGDTLVFDPTVRIEILSPDTLRTRNSNNASMVVRLTYGSTTFLFTGDAEEEVEQELVSRYGAYLASDVVKVGHHGSRTSSIPLFVEAVTEKPTAYAVVSVGLNNVYRLPHQEVIERWRDRGTTVHKTSREAALWLRSTGEQIERVDWKAAWRSPIRGLPLYYSYIGLNKSSSR